jgi:hypothetical protein
MRVISHEYSSHSKHTKYSSKIQTTGKLITGRNLQGIPEKEELVKQTTI